MGSSPRTPKKDLFRLLFPLFVTLLIAFTPAAFQMIYFNLDSANIPTVLHGELEVPEGYLFSHSDHYLVGTVELFYGRWICSEPEEEERTIEMSTPGNWTGLISSSGEELPKEGYGSYRYRLKGLMPGKTIFPLNNLESPSRIFFNGTLVGRIGNPSKSPQDTFVSLDDAESYAFVVPQDGIVEYVLEVGNTGIGGVRHLNLIYYEGGGPVNITNRWLAPAVVGFLLAATILAVPFIVLNSRKRNALWLLFLIIAVALLHLFSKDSMLLGIGASYSVPFSECISLFVFAAIGSALLLYARREHDDPLKLPETITLIVSSFVCAFIYPHLWGTPYHWIPLLALMLMPLYVLLRQIGYLIVRKKLHVRFMLLNGSFLAYGLLALLFRTHFYTLPFIVHPTIFAIFATATLFATGFYDAYALAKIKKDALALKRRYYAIRNRAFAHFSQEDETRATLLYIARCYEGSNSVGDKTLINVSQLMRLRLLALRESVIPFSRECDLESRISAVRCAVHERDVELVLDYEEGEFLVPPLIFEDAIFELEPQIPLQESIILSEMRDGVRLQFPSQLTLSDNVYAAIVERASIVGLSVRSTRGMVHLFKESLR